MKSKLWGYKMTDLLLFFALFLLIAVVNNTAAVGSRLKKINENLEEIKSHLKGE